MDQLRQDLSFALRSLGRKPAFTLLGAAMLALGIGANTAIFSVVNAVALRPLPYEDPEALLYIGASRDGELRALSAPEFLRLRDESRAFEGVAVETHLNFLGQDAPERISGARISASSLSAQPLSLRSGLRHRPHRRVAPRVRSRFIGL